MFRSGPDRVEYNRVGPSRGHKIYFFRVWSGSGKDITGHYGVGVTKTLPRRTLHTAGIFICDTSCFLCNSINCDSKFIESQWKYAVSHMKIPAVHDSVTSVLIKFHPSHSESLQWLHKSDFLESLQNVIVKFWNIGNSQICACQYSDILQFVSKFKPLWSCKY